MIEIKINDGKTMTLSDTKEGVIVDGSPAAYALTRVSPSSYKIIGKKNIFDVELISQEGKEIKLAINNTVVSLNVADHIDQILEKLGMDTSQSTVVKEIKAPMPGSILDILVKEGDQVQANDQLLVLEAMKMENVIKSTGEGTVSRIHVDAKENVEKNQVLISFE